VITQIEPWIDQEELTQLIRVVDSTYVTEHYLTREFETIIKNLSGAKHAISMTNGTAALYCCLKAIDISPGDEVIVPDLTFIATSNAVIMAGGTPVFCDVTSDTFCLEPIKIKALINNKTKAIIPVHLYGQSADMTKIMDVAREHELYVIEDAAQGVGVRFNGKHVGTFGDMGILSFYGNKTITCGEGGIVLTNDDNFAKICYRLKNHGRDEKGTFVHEHVGFNFCFTEMQAAIGISQLKKLDRIVEKKRKIYERYRDALEQVPGIKFPDIDERTTPVHWFTSIMTDRRDELKEYLTQCDIQTRLFFYPLHKQPCYSNIADANRHYDNSSTAFERGLSLPSAYNLSTDVQDMVIGCIKDFYLNE
jgi:perosamine synthetase